MDKRKVQQFVDRIGRLCRGCKRQPRIMEICGTHTVSLLRSGVKSLLGDALRLISGPGCPVCVTSQGYVDAACDLADRPDVTICTYGDMVRVPGSRGSLEQRRAEGGHIMVVYCPRDALRYAADHPNRQVVFLAIGFETTAPATAATILEAERREVSNFFVLTAHKLVIPAVAALLSGGETSIDGLLCPGHVSVVIGADAYRPLADNWAMPCAIAGFEPLNMLAGIAALAEQIAAGRANVQNVYGVAVSPGGNRVAQDMISRVLAPAPAIWRAMGAIDASGLELRECYARFDARRQLDIEIGPDHEPPGCLCGQVIQGKADPPECGLFAAECTPLTPVGPCMVSSEGTCAAWYKYSRRDTQPAQVTQE